uniref:Uncharacterized protein n=1 Tax=Arundo donax TaxID=35708 RepID=A0A0A8Z7C0_ARUDO
MNRAKMETEAAAYKSMQGSQGISERTAGSQQYCKHDYMQAMAMEKRIKEEGLRWQRDAAAATAASNLHAGRCLVKESDPFQIRRPEPHHLGLVLKQQGSKEKGNACPLFSISARDEPEEPPERCSLSLSLGLDPKCARAMASSPSGSSCILSASPTRWSSSDCSGHSGCFVTPDVSLELSLSICGS